MLALPRFISVQGLFVMQARLIARPTLQKTLRIDKPRLNQRIFKDYIIKKGKKQTNEIKSTIITIIKV